MTLYGDRGSLHSGRDGYVIYDGDGKGEPMAWPDDDLSDYAHEMEAFADAVSGNAWGPTTAESERRSLAVVLAGYVSAEREAPVRLNEMYPDI